MLKGIRNEIEVDPSFYMNEAAERGVVVSVSTTGSGAAMDSSDALVTVRADGSGAKPVGILLNDMVNIDITRQHINFYKDEVLIGGKVSILRKGWVVTDQILGDPVGGEVAYVADSGLISPSQDGNAPAIGHFLSIKDLDGFAKVSVNI